MREFCPGQRVLCIDGKFHPSVWEYVNEVPIEGEVYTVDWIRKNGRDNVTGQIGPALSLKEVPGGLTRHKLRGLLVCLAFRPARRRRNKLGREEKEIRRQKEARSAAAP